MKTKKYLIAIAILGGMLFTAYAANTINQNEQQTAVDGTKLKKAPQAG